MASRPTKSSSWIMSEYDALDEASQEQLVHSLRDTVHPKDGAHWCPMMNTAVVSPCLAKSCEFSFDKASHLNCMIFKAKEKPIDSVAALLGTDNVKAREYAAEAIRQMRLAVLTEAVNKKSINHYTMIPADICVNCGCSVDKPSHVVWKYKYCSRACFVDRPPYVVLLEHKFKADPRVVLRVAKDVFKTLTMISAVLKIQRSNLLKLYEKYLGIAPVDWGASVSDIVDMVRRKKALPSVDNFIISDKSEEVRYAHWFKLERECREIAKSL